ncbi:MAG: CopG family transcriptional regulator [Firmicutes bacterium]|jgi:RHH-type rel operon transcriptional repressor/antitoxin RelB|nr:CopG family transcriptional regulator [Candidatus Fermentithermobacillaceae bacterium]
MSISVRLTNEEVQLIKRYAALKRLSVSDVVRTAVLEKIEDEFDLKTALQALEEHKKNPVTYTHDEVKKILELG